MAVITPERRRAQRAQTSVHKYGNRCASIAIILLTIWMCCSCAPVENHDPADEQAETASSATVYEAGNADKDEMLPEDGTYVPSVFTVKGGTGKVTFTCPEVVLAEGRAEAMIELSSPHYEWLGVDGVQYDPVNAGDGNRENSVFRIPVRLDEEMTITGLTTAMSEPHEIEYTVFISLTQEEKPAPEGGTAKQSETAASEAEEQTANARTPSEPPVLEGLTFVSSMETSYAETFAIYTYCLTGGSGEDRYRLIDVRGSAQYLLLPKNSETADSAIQQEMLEDLSDDITVLTAPLDNIYVAATSSMALFDRVGAIGQVKLTGTEEDGWYIDAPREALADGSMVYAGKYSAPDYELLASSGCDLAVESMMILHAPEVKEKLEELGIPVFIDTSSNENHPLGRTEWVRLYGVLTGHETEAEAFFEEQKQEFSEAENYTDTGLTVAFFSISSGGNVIVRATGDYIPRMIELAGGHYIFKDLLEGSGNSASVRLSMEDFYNTAKDADFLIYNATIENPVRSISELCGRSQLLGDFKAVQEGNVWQAERSLYQSPDIAAQMITDLRRMLTGEDSSETVFLEQLGQ